VYGLSGTTANHGGRRGIGDWIGGNVDTTTSVCHGPSGMAFQGVGEVTCSLGEIANRGDFIMFWGSNPAESHPRHFTKYSLMPGDVPPNGRKDRTAWVMRRPPRRRPTLHPAAAVDFGPNGRPGVGRG
jgi:formylmethanofuran dehydrogenase subunit B